MSAGKPPWGLAAAYLIYRRTISQLNGKQTHVTRGQLIRLLLLLMLTMPVAGPILWHAFWVMPPALALFLGSAIAVRIVRWYWRRHH